MQCVLKILLSASLLCEAIVIGSPQSSRTTEPPAPKQTSNARMFAKGPLVKIDPANQIMVVNTQTGPVTFTLTDQTKIFRGKVPGKITGDQLRPGETIALSYYADEGGRLLVVRIKAAPVEVPQSTEAVPAPPRASQP